MAGPSRHFALRINCVAFGAKRTLASWARDAIQERSFDCAGSQASQGRARVAHIGPTYGAAIDLDFKIREHRRRWRSRIRADARPLTSITLQRRMPPDDSAESTGERWKARYPGSRRSRQRLLSHRWAVQTTFSRRRSKAVRAPNPFAAILQHAKPDGSSSSGREFPIRAFT
jgi:hypothetical protein